jgi:hypothetical protein
MSPPDPHDELERRPAMDPSDTRLASEVAVSMRFLLAKFPEAHVCAKYEDDLIIVSAVDHDGVTLDQEWIAK